MTGEPLAEWERDFLEAEAVKQAARLQLVVLHPDHQYLYYPVDQGWRIDNASRCIVVGRGVPRTYIPLDTVRSFTIERIGNPAYKDDGRTP